MKFIEAEKQFREPLLSYFRRRLAQAHDAEDLVQEVFLKLGQLESLNRVSNPQHYIFRVAANQLRDHVRRETFRRRERHVSVGDLVQHARMVHQLVDEIEPERVLLGKDRLALVNKALAGLSERTRDILMLYRVEGLKRGEIAERHGISVSAVEKHLAKAIACIAAQLEGGDDA